MGDYNFSQEEIKAIKKGAKKGIIGIIIFIIILIIIFGSFRTINSGEVGIRVRFGKVVTTQM